VVAGEATAAGSTRCDRVCGVVVGERVAVFAVVMPSVLDAPLEEYNEYPTVAVAARPAKRRCRRVNVAGGRCSSSSWCERAPGRGLSTSFILRCVVCPADVTVSSFHEVSRMRPSRSVLVAFAASALVASACGGSSETESEASVPNTASVATEQPADVEPVFVPTAAGGQLDFNSLRGQDVLLWFWAPW
jgi:hypothetical protein